MSAIVNCARLTDTLENEELKKEIVWNKYDRWVVKNPGIYQKYHGKDSCILQ